MNGKGDKRRKEDKSKVNANWPYECPFERKQAERREREQAQRSTEVDDAK